MVGIDNLKWRDAVAAAFRYFTREQASAGWPEDMTPAQLAGLQRPHLGSGAPESLRRCQSLASKIVTDCQSGELLSTATTRTPQPAKPPVQQRSRFASDGWLNRDGFMIAGMPARIGYREPGTPPKPVTTYHVTAADFAAWLAAQGEKPSEHIAAWFDAVGVDMDTRPIAPPTGWQARTEHGLLRFDDTDAGRLVRLADLVTWLMDSRELPCKPAVEMVCTALESNPGAAASLYLLTESGYAKPLPASHTFYSEPLVSFWDAQPQGDDTDKGVVGAVKYMRDYWGESPAPGASKRMGKEVLDPLCTRLDVAFRLWGYGHRVDEVQPDDAPTVALASQTPPPAPAVVIEPTRESPAKLKRRNLLTPVIERAQRECSAPFEASAVFPVLMRMAEASEKPFIGATDDGIKWKNHNDEIQFLSLKNLRDRLRRQEKRAAQPQKTPLKRVK